MRREINPKLKEGDRITLVSMGFDPDRVKVGEKGTVTGISHDPFSEDPMYLVKWDNGRRLNLIPSEDLYVKEENETINESINLNEQNLCSSFEYGFGFCLGLTKILKAGKGGSGSSTLKKNTIEFFKNIIQGEFTGLGKKIELKPGVKFFDERQKELKKFYKLLRKSGQCKKMMEDVKKDIKNVETKNLKMVVDDDENYSLLNRIDTHYTFKAYLITKAVLKVYETLNMSKKIDELSSKEIVDVVNKVLWNTNTKNILDKQSLEYIDKLIQSSLSDDMEREMLMASIDLTRSAGNNVETQVAELLRNKGFEVYEFGQDFGFVDNFGVDMVVKDKKGKLHPTQVSTSRKINPKLFDYNQKDCECWAIYKTHTGYRKETLLEEKKMNFIDKAKKVLPIIHADRDKSIFNMLLALREIGIINMFASAPFTWGGDRYMKNQLTIYELHNDIELDEDKKENLLELARLSQSNMVNAAIDSLEKKGEELSTDNINRELRRLANIAFEYYVLRF